jgi:hypothetical protein
VRSPALHHAAAPHLLLPLLPLPLLPLPLLPLPLLPLPLPLLPLPLLPLPLLQVLNVMRNLMSWRLHPSCACPSLPRAAAAGFVGLLHALLPHLPPPEEGAARRAHAELIEALWVRIAPPATRPPPPSALGGTSGARGVGAEPPVALPLASLPPTSSIGLLEREHASATPLPTDESAEQLELESTTLAAARRVLLSTSMSAALRRRLLQLPCAVLALPPRAATQRDECWRNAASTLCMLSSRVPNAAAALAAAAPPDADAPPPDAAPASASSTDGSGGPCAALAAPMLVVSANSVLREWSACELSELGDAVGARAAQMAHLLHLLGTLTLPDGVLPDPATAHERAGGARAAPPAAAPAPAPATPAVRSGRRAHLLHLAPCLIECIGQPAMLYASGAVPPSTAELSAGVRRLLHLVAAEMSLE